MIRQLSILFLIFISFNLQGQEIIYSGIVTNIDTQESLVFVSISKNRHQGGTTSDLDGHFTILATLGDTLHFSYVGYAKQTLILGSNDQLHIELSPQISTLQEVIVRPSENPAWRIIRQVLAKRKENDPQNYDGYSYNAYNKTVLAIDSLSADETWQPPKEPKRDRQKKALAKASKVRNIFNTNMHLWVTESYTKNYFRKTAQKKQKTLAYESSMPNDFTGGLNPIDFQPFGFYRPLIRMEFTNQNYVNPISRACFQHYDFELKDTLFHSLDTTFVISFKPLKGKHFVALEGLLYINTNNYAIEHVIASSADKNQTLQFEIQQQSKLVNGRWFPQQLNTDLFIEMRLQERFIEYAFRNRSLIDSINYEVPESSIFNHYLRENTTTQTAFPDSLRPLPLSHREINTYTHWDSLPELRAPYRFLKTYNGIIKILATGLLESDQLDFIISDIVRYNKHEGLRIGLGLQNSPKLLQHHTFYGYAAYGLNDQQWKYGAAWDIKLYPHRDLTLRTAYKKDLTQPGSHHLFLSAINRPWSTFNIRNFALSRLDVIEQYRIDLFHRPHPAWQWNLSVQQEKRTPAYSYEFSTQENQRLRSFNVKQASLRIRWSPKEQLVKMDQLEAILYPTFPIIDLSASYGNFDDLDISFFNISGRIDHEFRSKYIGNTSITLEGGYLNTPLPYPYLFQVSGNNATGIAHQNSFNTAGITEFINQEYIYAFITHDFGHLLGKSNKLPWFRPELNLRQNIGWGKNYATNTQHSFPLQDFSKVYLESAVGLKNILRIPYFKSVYIGLGGALYYRWGAYQFPRVKDNLFWQFLVTLSV